MAETNPLTIAMPLRLTRCPATPPHAIGPYGRQQVRDGLVAEFDDVHRRACTYDAQVEWHRAQMRVPGVVIPQHWLASIAAQVAAQDRRHELLVERQGLCDAWLEENMAGPVPHYEPRGGNITDLAIRFARMDDRVERLHGPAGIGD